MINIKEIDYLLNLFGILRNPIFILYICTNFDKHINNERNKKD